MFGVLGSFALPGFEFLSFCAFTKVVGCRSVCVVFFFYVTVLDTYYKSLFNLCCLKAIWRWFALSQTWNIDSLFLFVPYGMRGRAFVYRWWCRRRRVTIDSHSSSPACVYLGVVVCLRTHARTQFVWYVCTGLWVFFFLSFSEECLWWPDHVVCLCVCVLHRRNASSWAEPSDGGGASADHPRQFNWPQHGGWQHRQQHPGLRQRTGTASLRFVPL